MKIPSPCISVCKFKNAGHCVGCGMTKKQKKKFKRLEGRKKKLRFIEALRIQQQEVGLKANWERAYRRRCRKKGVDCPLDRAEAPASPELPLPPPVPAAAPVA
ncbi:DUF1289 domain-containing protein [Hyphomicrobium sp. D-2]|uniref:DUF1289 domain-containing protein n=1 Tax=Hyphomicrobium sp. D-2 TaxID=3041621 RepID=UPI002458D953|nr:DUF1289 domain-containing protein [Hyphomicrobium sp. D-2]MDH4982295.1 DUF1289 domain-containing protein [Hyphomicrobium sp. D-2]